MAYQNQYKCRTEEAITHFIELKKSKEIIFRNRKWASIKTCCEFLWYKRRFCQDRYVESKMHTTGSDWTGNRMEKGTWNHISWCEIPILPQCCEDLEINPISVRLYMEKNGVSSTRAITHYIKSKEKRAFEFRGKEYKKFYGMLSCVWIKAKVSKFSSI